MLHSTKTLYIGGGATASVFTAGMLAELDSHDLINDFEYIVGVSSGSFSACFVAGEATQFGADGYWRMFPQFYRDTTFVSLRHLLKLRPIMNVRYLVNIGLTRADLNPIPWQRVLDSHWNQEGKLLIQVTDTDTGQPFFCSHFKTIVALQDAVTASCAIPFTAAIRPFAMKKESFENMCTRNHKGEFFTKKTTKCWDGEISDMHFRTAQSFITSDSTCILTTAHPDHSNKCYPLGRQFWVLEMLLGWPMFFPYFRAVRGYQKERIFGGAEKQFNLLSKQSKQDPEKIQLITVPSGVQFNLRDVLSVDTMKKHLQTGRDTIKPWLL